MAGFCVRGYIDLSCSAKLLGGRWAIDLKWSAATISLSRPKVRGTLIAHCRDWQRADRSWRWQQNLCEGTPMKKILLSFRRGGAGGDDGIHGRGRAMALWSPSCLERLGSTGKSSHRCTAVLPAPVHGTTLLRWLVSLWIRRPADWCLRARRFLWWWRRDRPHPRFWTQHRLLTCVVPFITVRSMAGADSAANAADSHRGKADGPENQC